MLWVWWIYGGIVGSVMLFFVIDAYLGMPTLVYLTGSEWDATPSTGPRLSVIVPACNEERDIAACLRSLLEQDYEALEVIAVDDRSTDSTGAIMDELARSDPRLHVIHIAELPAGWLGKPHAMWQGAQVAAGDWLLFTDADVLFRADCLRRSLAYAQASHADHLVLLPSFIMESFGEQVALAVFQLGFIAARPWKVPDPRSPAHLGAGAFNMVTRTAYEGIGTFAALRLAIVEDLGFGRLVKEAGFASRVALGPGLVRLHWVTGLFGITRALTKNIYAFVGFRWYTAVVHLLLIVAFHLGAYVCIWFAPGWSKLGFAVFLVGLFALYARLRPALGIHPLFFFLHPIGGSLLLYAALRSVVVTIRDGGVTWRGTFYPVAMLKQQKD